MPDEYDLLSALMGGQAASALLQGVNAFTRDGAPHSSQQKRDTAASLRSLAERLDPPEREINLAINEDWIQSALARRDISPDDYDVDAVMDELADLWDFEHLENKAQELIEYALERSREETRNA